MARFFRPTALKWSAQSLSLHQANTWEGIILINFRGYTSAKNGKTTRSCNHFLVLGVNVTKATRVRTCSTGA